MLQDEKAMLGSLDFHINGIFTPRDILLIAQSNPEIFIIHSCHTAEEISASITPQSSEKLSKNSSLEQNVQKSENTGESGGI